ncbi:MAG: hypothetical protein FJ034_03120 [Chloroflexi bacterium]|nr:hypothetical protein [Chloroflexota bacterium]
MPLTRRSFLNGIASAGVGAAVAACAPAATPAAPTGLAPRRGGTLTYANSADPPGLDPAYGGDSVSGAMFYMLYQQLVSFTPELKIVPRLATSWEAKDTTWTFALRRGVKFHDGTSFNAAAVKAHFDRLLGPEKPTGGGPWVPILSSIDAVDEYTVRFTTKFPDAFFLERLADSYSSFLPSPAAVAQYGKDIARRPVGSGPFRFNEWVKDDRIVVDRFDDYWGDKAYLDRVIMKPVPEAEGRAIGVEAGDIQLAIRMNIEQLGRLERNADVRVRSNPTLRHLFIGLANLKKPFDDRRVRQALNYAIDKDSIVKNMYANQADKIGGAVPRGAAGYVDVPGYPYNPDKAKQLLAEAGYGRGFSANLVGPKGTYVKDFELQQEVQKQLKAVGVEVKFEVLEFAKWLSLLREDPRTSKMEMWMDAGGGVNPINAISGRYGCAQFRPAGGNTAGSCFSELDKLTTEAERTLDSARRNTLVKQAQEMVSIEAPSIFLVQTKEALAMRAKLHDPVHLWSSVLTVDEHTWLEP